MSPTPTLGGIGISAGLAAGLLAAPVPAVWSRALLVALAILLVLVGWAVTITLMFGDLTNLGGAFDAIVIVLQIATIVVFFGGEVAHDRAADSATAQYHDSQDDSSTRSLQAGLRISPDLPTCARGRCWLVTVHTFGADT